jgi:hydroxymethylbilane synthase
MHELPSPLVIATRESRLALWQAHHVQALLRDRLARDVDLLGMTTRGDQILDRALSKVGGKGLFVKELEVALLEGRADLAVHSMKDLPADLEPGLTVAAVPERESPWDLLVTVDGRGLDALPTGARIGTSSLRRQIQLKVARPDLVIEMLRGNVDTRLRRLREGAFDAIVIAEAGVRRLGFAVNAVRLEGIVVPAIAQGALALETREGDAETIEAVRVLTHAESELRARAERSVLRSVQGSCTTPVGALAVAAGGTLRIDGFLATPDGLRHVRGSVDARESESAERTGERLAQQLIAALA